MITAERVQKVIPEFCKSHWLIRVPLIIVFFQQGLNKLPVSALEAEAWGLPYIVWFFVAWGEVFAAIFLAVGGFLEKNALGDIVTRFAGILITGIMSGVILMSQPPSFLDVLLYDNYHVMLYLGGLYFALRGNRK